MELQPHQKRVVDEERELCDKLQKLLEFIETDTFRDLVDAEQLRLLLQLTYMDLYCKVLRARIEEFHA
jgi:hypothetical protein